MPVQGNNGGNNQPPPVAPNKTGQMRSSGSKHNPRGKGKPRAQTRPMKDIKGGKGDGVPGINKFLSGDITYKGQVADLTKNRQSFLTDWRADREDLNETYGQTLNKMQRERKRSREQIMNDFMGRGLIHSGQFAKSDADYNTEWNIRKNELSDDRTERLEDLIRSRQLFLDESKAVKHNARDEAIRRRAQKFGLR